MSGIHVPGPPPAGPGVQILADGSLPGTWVTRTGDGLIGEMTAPAIAAEPIHGQWFTGTKNGLLASWPTKAIAESHRRAYGVILGQMVPRIITSNDLGEYYVVLADEHGRPLRGGRPLP